VLFGYAHVSTAEQNPDYQVDALLHAGVAAKDRCSRCRTSVE
jgi:hypothetical protein